MQWGILLHKNYIFVNNLVKKVLTLSINTVKIQIDIMNKQLLKKIGLTESQAKTYLALIEAGKLTPPQLAKKINEGRTTAYMALAKLEELGLAKISEQGKKTYEPASPSVLSEIISKRKQELDAVDATYRQSLSEMLAYYFDKRTKPGVKFFSGPEGLKEVYADHIKTAPKDLYLIRTYADEPHFGEELYQYLDDRAKVGTRTHALMPLDQRSYRWAQANDKRLNREITWYPSSAYTAPVEIAIYDNKVSFISFGDEAVGTILESPQIAESMRQIHKMAEIGFAITMKQKKDTKQE